VSYLCVLYAYDPKMSLNGLVLYQNLWAVQMFNGMMDQMDLGSETVQFVYILLQHWRGKFMQSASKPHWLYLEASSMNYGKTHTHTHAKISYTGKWTK